MKKRGNKKASLPAKVIVGVIIGIFLFLLGVVFYYRLQPKEIVDRQACHQSILLRDAANIDPTNAVKLKIPLQCQTQKICINTGNFLTRAFSTAEGEKFIDLERARGSCHQFSDRKSGVKTIAVSGDIEKAKKEIVSLIADEMAGCWKTVGEGHLDYSPRGLEKESYCSICTRIAFDETVKELGVKRILYKDLFEYMESIQLPSPSYNKKISYLKYVYNKESLAQINEQIKKAITTGIEGEKGINYLQNPDLLKKDGKPISIYDLEIDTSENSEYAVITKFSKPGWENVIFGSAGGGVVGAVGAAAGIAGLLVVTAATGGLVTIGVGTLALLAVGGTTAGVATGAGSVFFSEEFGKVETSRPSLIPFTTQELRRYGCTEFEWIQG